MILNVDSRILENLLSRILLKSELVVTFSSDHFLPVPPGEPTLSWRGQAVSGGILGPVKEGTYVHATCTSTGGRPPPIISWWQAGKQLDGISRRSAEDREHFDDVTEIDENVVNGKQRKLKPITVSSASKNNHSEILGDASSVSNDSILIGANNDIGTNIGANIGANNDHLHMEISHNSVSNTITLEATRALLNVPVICQVSIPQPAQGINIPKKMTALVLNILRKYGLRVNVYIFVNLLLYQVFM